MQDMKNRITDWVEGNSEECLEFLREVISIPSPSREEQRVAGFLADKMREYGFSTAATDGMHDAMGTIDGRGGGRSLLLNGHIDHVPVGAMPDPYSGRVMEGSAFGVEGQVVYGRAACDMKAAVAAMVLAGKAIKELGISLKGDYKVAAVAQEEVGGAGTMSTIVDSQFLADVVLIGEATNMGLALGHRGSMRFGVVVKGRSCHASAPERGVNALYKATDMIQRIREDLVPRLPEHPVYGRASLVVTQIEVSPKASNVVPERCVFWIDCRNHPGFTAETLYAELKNIVADLKSGDPDFEATVLPTTLINERRFSGFYTDPDKHPVVKEATDAISEAYREPETGLWTFATDGRIYSRLGLPVIGFGPGEERFAHTHQDHVKVNDFLDTVKVYVWLACRICGVSEN
ncbi:ArgE/DapE family deacylase [Candidatus Bathyarchaeota archaeon]|nr:ArgE/DapE family deacylase [Candidatus Bathyarchaeota archaeon]